MRNDNNSRTVLTQRQDDLPPARQLLRPETTDCVNPHALIDREAESEHDCHVSIWKTVASVLGLLSLGETLIFWNDCSRI